LLLQFKRLAGDSTAIGKTPRFIDILILPAPVALRPIPHLAASCEDFLLRKAIPLCRGIHARRGKVPGGHAPGPKDVVNPLYLGETRARLTFRNVSGVATATESRWLDGDRRHALFDNLNGEIVLIAGVGGSIFAIRRGLREMQNKPQLLYCLVV